MPRSKANARTLVHSLARALFHTPRPTSATFKLMRRLKLQSQFQLDSRSDFTAFAEPIMSLQPDFGLNSCLFPPLPHIEREDIRMRVFTHRSYFARPTHVFEDRLDDPSPDNEKFEHLGDSVLGLVVTSLMLEMYPGLRVGPSTKVRAMIVGNATLAEISVKYRLPEKLRLHPAQAVTLCASTNVQADVFESFIGGLYTEQGLAAVAQWLNPLFRPYAKAAYAVVRAQHGLPPVESPLASPSSSRGVPSPLGTDTTIGHLALFNQHLQKSDQRVEWVYSDHHPFGEVDTKSAIASPTPADVNRFAQGNKSTPVWSVQVLVDGQPFGRGRGNTKKAARNEAAKEGLVQLGVAFW
ncbi:ribonuclease III domain-containing protein [Mycena alexandri]|uniref:Ribonuclease III domain-containing protein n=1 Tax=Mycena alexandri TaxID=1745969 RepID=A0AAD6XCG6_9AGAR|nr:ribonuclease III domain-containing protein [Mycena alexandri]